MTDARNTIEVDPIANKRRRGKVWLYRSLLDDPATILRDALLLQLWMLLLLRATYKPRTVDVTTGRGKTSVTLLPGQCITGIPSLSKFTGMKPRTLRRKLRELQQMKCISYTPGPHYSIVTIPNWAIYQTPQKRVQANGKATWQGNLASEHGEATNAVERATVDVSCDAVAEPWQGNMASDVVTPRVPKHGNKQERTTNKVLTNTRSSLRSEPADRELADHIWSKLHILQPTRRAPSLEAWANSLRLAREVDGRTLADLREVFDRAHADPFWQKNILSPDKLREKFDDLELRLTRNATNGNLRTNDSAARPRSGRYDADELNIIRPATAATRSQEVPLANAR